MHLAEEDRIRDVRLPSSSTLLDFICCTLSSQQIRVVKSASIGNGERRVITDGLTQRLNNGSINRVEYGVEVPYQAQPDDMRHVTTYEAREFLKQCIQHKLESTHDEQAKKDYLYLMRDSLAIYVYNELIRIIPSNQFASLNLDTLLNKLASEAGDNPDSGLEVVVSIVQQLYEFATFAGEITADSELVRKVVKLYR